MNKDLEIELDTLELVQLLHKARPDLLWDFGPEDYFEVKARNVNGVLDTLLFRFRRTDIDIAEPNLVPPDGIEDGKL